ncbi:hypothetical protein K438DRAFT_1979100 [Mycena galopus ATCC 62051]|nr:hypothetical protein K438DRAFT_1979100 [Mycena galopus ATCC 62051]
MPVFFHVSDVYRPLGRKTDIYLLAVEILAAVFLSFCAACNPRTRSFGRARSTLSLVCKSWFNIAHFIPDLWTVLYIDDLATVECVQSFLTVVPLRTFDVAVVSGGSGPSHANFRSQWNRILPALEVALPSVTQWRALHLYSNYLPTLQFILDHVMDCPGLSISTLSVTRYTYLAPRYLQEPKALTLHGPMASITALHLVSVPIPFTDVLRGQALVRLHLEGLPSSAWPCFEDFAACVAASPHLTHLSICSTGCQIPSAAQSDALILSTVRYLRLAFCRTNAETQRSGFSFIGQLRFPSLLFLDLALETTSRLISFNNHGIRLQAPSVQLTSESSDRLALAQLYATFDRVVVLDLHGCGSRAIVTLEHRSPTGLPFLPLLRELVVLEEEWSALLTMAKGRGAHSALLSIFVLPLEACGRLPSDYHRVVAPVANVIWLRWPVMSPTFSHHNYFD